MKITYLLRMAMRIALVLTLFASHHVFAGQQITVLGAIDSSSVRQGVFEEAADSVANLDMTVLGQAYLGTGIIRDNVELSILAKQRQGLRSDRAFLAKFNKPHNKHAKLMLVSNKGATLACELSVYGSEQTGHCVNPENQQIFNLKMTAGAP